MTAGTAAPATGRLAVAGVVAACACAALLGWVVIEHGRPLAWDRALHIAVVAHRTAALTTVAAALSAANEVLTYVVAAAGGLLALQSRPWWRGLLTGAAALGAGQLLRFGLSVAVGRSRPPVTDWARSASGYSFPSGRTTTAALAAGVLCLGLVRSLRGAVWMAGIVLASVWAVAVGASRVYLGVHWPTDVLGGWLLGAVLTVLTAVLLRRLNDAGSDPSGPQRAQQQAERHQLQRGDDREQRRQRAG